MGSLCPQPIRSVTLEKLSREKDNDILNITGRFLLIYAKYREVLMKSGGLYCGFIYSDIMLDVVLLFRFLLFFDTLANKICIFF